MELVDAFVKGRDPSSRYCEDGFVVMKHFAAVIDVDAPMGSDRGKTQSGELLKDLLEELIPRVPSTDTLTQWKRRIDERLTLLYSQLGDLGYYLQNPTLKPQINITAYHVRYNELWMIGSGHALVDGHALSSVKKPSKSLFTFFSEEDALIPLSSPPTSLILASDGYSKLYPTLKETEKNHRMTPPDPIDDRCFVLLGEKK